MAFIDYLLLTPLDEEWRTIRNILCPDYEAVKDVQVGAITYYAWKQPVNRPPDTVGDYLIAAAPMSKKTPAQSKAGNVTTQGVGHWKPNRVTMLGIAGSLEPDRLKLGDVVVPEEIFGYEVGDVVGRNFTFRPTLDQTGALDFDRVRAFYNDPVQYPRWQQECLAAAKEMGLKKLKRPPQLHLEPVASGNFVVKSVTHGRKLRKEINSKIAAVEMEARGMYQALYMEAQRRDALMIRGISDYADTNKSKLEKQSNDGWRAFSVANAARLLLALWRRGPIPPISPEYQLNLSKGPRTLFRQKDIPNIEQKAPGAQSIVFPYLLDRNQPNPALEIEVTVYDEAGLLTSDFSAFCLVESPGRQTIHATQGGTGKRFMLPGSEWGLKVGLFLSSRSAMSRIEVVCRDDFQRSSEATFESRKS